MLLGIATTATTVLRTRHLRRYQVLAGERLPRTVDSTGIVLVGKEQPAISEATALDPGQSALGDYRN